MNDITIINNAGTARSDLAEALDRLERAYKLTPVTEQLPPTLPVGAITTAPEVFYTRGQEVSEDLIGQVSRAIQDGHTVNPVLVLRCGDRSLLIDGHHRLEAYKRNGNALAVLVEHFSGSPRQAVLEAVRRNSLPSIQMTGPQRQNVAWRLVLAHAYSKREIASASGVSYGQVGIMRSAAKALGETALEMSSWWQAQRTWKGKEQHDFTEDERDAWINGQGQRAADGYRDQFGMWLANHPEFAAIGLVVYFGRRSAELLRELKHLVAEAGYLDDDEAEDAAEF